MNTRSNLRSLLNTAFGLLATCFFVSCSWVEEHRPDHIRSSMIEISVASEELTKATPTDSESAINSLYIYAFQGDKNVGFLQRSNVVPGEPFYMDLQLPEKGTHSVDFFLVANAEEMDYLGQYHTFTESTTRSQLLDLKYSGLHSSSHEPIYLPMYAQLMAQSINVENILGDSNAAAGHEGHVVLNQKLVFELSRSLAKISLFAATEAGNSQTPQILSVSMLAEGTRQFSYLFPQEDAVLNAIASRPNDRSLFVGPANVTRQVVKGTTEQADPANYNAIFTDAYLPEVTYGSASWNMSSGNSREVVLHVRFSPVQNGATQNAYVYMPPILRNTHYKVCVLIGSEGQIIVNYEVDNWEDNNTSSITFDYPTHSYLLDFVPTSLEEMGKRPAAPASMTETQPFVGYFQMSYPNNDRWIPTLTGLNASNATVRVFEGATHIEVPQSEWPIQASEKWYRIEVSPKYGKMAEDEEVRLSITYTPIGFETPEYLLINGAHDEYHWPYHGTSEQDAEYVIITLEE